MSFGNRTNGGYDLSELRYRPLEQILEVLTCRQLGEALGISHSTASFILRDPFAFVDTKQELDDQADQKIRRYLETGKTDDAIRRSKVGGQPCVLSA
jgi:hypothetical protein